MNFGFLLFNDLEELDLVGPWEMIGMWGEYAGGPKERMMIAETKEPVSCTNGMRILPDVTFEESPQLDYLLVPGGFGTRREVTNKTLIEFVSHQAKGCQAVLSVCTGSFILHAAGLLSGKRATTHWTQLEAMGKLEDVEVVEDRFICTDNIWTAAGVSAGIDLALALIAQEAGEEAAGNVQAFAEYYPSGKMYGGFASDPKAPRYLKK